MALIGLLAAVCALDRDPYLARPTAALLPLPGRWPLRVMLISVLGLAAALLSLPDRQGSSAKPLGAGLLALLSLALLFLATPFVRPEVHCLGVAFNLALILSLALYLLRSHLRGSVDRPPRARLEDGLTATFTLALGLLVGEGIATLLPSSHAAGYPLASRAWFEKYWNPSNSAGYRDFERTDSPGRRIDVLGDSLVAGVGIANVEDRFTNLLDRRLSPEFHVDNLGANGSNTRHQLRRLLERPTSPDLLILSYYVNDIQEACEEVGHRMPSFTPYANLFPGLRGLVRRSYLLDGLYWRFPQGDLADLEGTLEACYGDPRAVEIHLRDLEGFIQYCRERHVPLLVVAFPHLVRAEPTRRLIGPVIDSLRGKGVPVLDVFPILDPLEVRLRIVNRNDAHPSIELNRLVAEGLLSLLESSGLLQEARGR